VVLGGRVGSKYVHDAAVRIAIDSGYSIRDDLKIDSSELYRVSPPPRYLRPYPTAYLGYDPFGTRVPSLFGPYNDPFFGLEPPLVTYPPWWGAVAAREPINTDLLQAAGDPSFPAATNPPASSTPNANDAATQQVPIDPGSGPARGTVEMTIDPRGVAVLRGTVPTLNDRIEIGQRIMRSGEVREVVNLLKVASDDQSGATSAPANIPGASNPNQTDPKDPNAPPPPPPGSLEPAPLTSEPAAGNARKDQAPGGQPVVTADSDELSQRLGRAFLNRPALANLPIRVSVREGVAYLSGEVPTVYEAMLAYRAAQQTPGVREVDDRLQFVVPDGEQQNPLQTKGRPEDIEPYLTAQIRRQAGEIAHIDQVHIQGDALEIKGSLGREEDRARLDAILRSIAVLRGYRLQTEFTVD